MEIRVPVERLREVSRTLDRQRQETDSLLQAVTSLLDNLSGDWSGLAQVDYAQIFNEQVPPMKTRFDEVLEHLADELHRIANDFEQTDEQALSGVATGVTIGAAVGGSTATGGQSSGSDSEPGKRPSNPPPSQPPTADVPTGVQRVAVNPNASTGDCVDYVQGQREVPSHILNWQNGGVDEHWNYGPAPKPGAMMVEGYDPDIGIGAEIGGTKWGHVSYVDWVEYNDAGEPIRFHIVEGGWDGGKKHEQTFDWPIGDSSRRRPHRFVYDKRA